jgi:hypothetical protein
MSNVNSLQALQQIAMTVAVDAVADAAAEHLGGPEAARSRGGSGAGADAAEVRDDPAYIAMDHDGDGVFEDHYDFHGGHKNGPAGPRAAEPEAMAIEVDGGRKEYWIGDRQVSAAEYDVHRLGVELRDSQRHAPLAVLQRLGGPFLV